MRSSPFGSKRNGRDFLAYSASVRGAKPQIDLRYCAETGHGGIESLTRMVADPAYAFDSQSKSGEDNQRLLPNSIMLR